MQPLTLDVLLKSIQSSDDTVRAAARDGAGPVGAKAIAPLAKIAVSAELEIARAARQAIQKIVYHAGRPGAGDEAKAVAAELVALLKSPQPAQFLRDVLWMVWQIAGEEAVEPVAVLLTSAELRDDARMALERLPGDKAVAALKAGLASAADDFKPNLGHSLRIRGVKTPGVPDLRLIPTKKTSVSPAGRKA
jgi:hypothetical protein